MIAIIHARNISEISNISPVPIYLAMREYDFLITEGRGAMQGTSVTLLTVGDTDMFYNL